MVSQPKNEISAAEGKAKVDGGALLVDVRTAEEFSSGHLPNALHIPYDQIVSRIDELGEERSRTIVLYCKTGPRATFARELLERSGFESAYAAGGLKDWLPLY